MGSKKWSQTNYFTGTSNNLQICMLEVSGTTKTNRIVLLSDFIENDLTGTVTGKTLDATQGKVLKDNITTSLNVSTGFTTTSITNNNNNVVIPAINTSLNASTGYTYNYYVNQNTTVNGHTLDGNITVTANDTGAYTSGQTNTAIINAMTGDLTGYVPTGRTIGGVNLSVNRSISDIGAAAINHNHYLSGLTEKSYNSLTDRPYIPTDYVTANANVTETINGLKTFTKLPVIPLVPLSDTDAASKGYVDAKSPQISPTYELFPQTANSTGKIRVWGTNGGNNYYGLHTSIPGNSPQIAINQNGYVDFTGLTSGDGNNILYQYADGTYTTILTYTYFYIQTNSFETYNTAVLKTGNQSIDGIKTFTSSPTIPVTPSFNTDAASKGYVDNHAFLGGIKLLATLSVTTGMDNNASATILQVNGPYTAVVNDTNYHKYVNLKYNGTHVPIDDVSYFYSARSNQDNRLIMDVSIGTDKQGVTNCISVKCSDISGGNEGDFIISIFQYN